MDDAEEGLGQAKLAHDDCPAGQGKGLEVHVELFEGCEGLRALRLFDRETPHRDGEGEWVETHLPDADVPVEGCRELLYQDRLEDRRDGEESHQGEDREYRRAPDEDPPPMAPEELARGDHDAPPCGGKE